MLYRRNRTAPGALSSLARPVTEEQTEDWLVILLKYGVGMDVNDRLDCEANIRKIEELLSCGILEPVNSTKTILQCSAFIHLMICLRDLLSKAEKQGKRISWCDDVIVNAYVHDITDAVIAVRDACCHIDSHKRRLTRFEEVEAHLMLFTAKDALAGLVTWNCDLTIRMTLLSIMAITGCI